MVLLSRVVLVTGGGRGLGRHLVAAFMEHGDTVVACGRHEPSDWLAGAEFETCDVRDATQVASLVAAVSDRHGRLDVVINNAGGTPYAPTAEMSPRLAERVVALNLLAPLYVAQQAYPLLRQQEGRGVILNIGSTAALRPSVSVAAYVAAKSGLAGLTRALAVEWAPDVRVNLITPGLLRTELLEETYGTDVAAVEATVPAGRFATGSDVAAACLALAEPGLSYVTGAELVVDGGGEVPSWLMAVRR